MPANKPSTPRTPDHAALGQAIKLVIAENPKLNQHKVATRSGLDYKLITAYARGEGNPTYLNLLRLCDGLGVSVGELITRAEDLQERQSGRGSRIGASG
jgi:transcriptional regulator with XRE-family HTH domain